MPGAGLHRLGPATAGTPTSAWSTRPSGTRCPAALDDEQVAPLLCAGIIGYRALLLCRGAARRCAGNLRVRRQRPSDRPVGAGPRPSGARADPGRTQPTAGPAARRGLGGRGRGRRRPNPSTARSCSPQPATWFRSRSARSTAAGPWLSPGSGSPTSRRLELPGTALPRTEAPLGDRQHPIRRRDVPPAGRTPGRPRHDRGLSDVGGPSGAVRPEARPFQWCGGAALLTCPTSAAIWAGPTRQQPPISRAPSSTHCWTSSTRKAGSPIQRRSTAFQLSPLLG